jgi:GTP cyclohydrolase II
MIPPKLIEQILEENKDHDCTGEKFGGACVKIVAIANLPTRYGHFQVVAFKNNIDGKDHAAVIKGNVYAQKDVVTRIHSQCLTGDGFGSLRCDCHDQLIASFEKIEKEKLGVVLYLRQEGRGIGFANKIRAYALQDKGYDTVEANKMLGFKTDLRDYGIAAHMLNSLKIESIRLLTNNPNKIDDLKKHRVKIIDRIPLITKPNKYNLSYLKTKQIKAGQLLGFPIHDGIEQEEKTIIEK